MCVRMAIDTTARYIATDSPLVMALARERLGGKYRLVFVDVEVAPRIPSCRWSHRHVVDGAIDMLLMDVPHTVRKVQPKLKP